MAQPVSDFFAAWELFREPALAGAVAGLLLGWVGLYVALRRMVFLSAAMTQTADAYAKHRARTAERQKADA